MAAAYCSCIHEYSRSRLEPRRSSGTIGMRQFAMNSSPTATGRSGANIRFSESDRRHRHEDKILLVLTLIIGAVVGLVVVAFILLTENLGSRMYPAGGAAWRRVLIPVVGALGTG